MKLPLQLFVLSLSGLFVGSAWSEPVPLDDFVRHGDYLELKLSPDGRHLAARVRRDESVFLLFYSTETKEVVGGLRPGEDSEVHSVTWVNNERVVFEYAESVGRYDHPVATGELYAVNIDGSSKSMIYGYRAGDSKLGTRISKRDDSFASQEVLSVLPDDDRHILIIEYPWSQDGAYWYDNRRRTSVISKLDVINGKKKKIETLPHIGTNAIATLDGEVNFISWRSEDDVFHAAYRESADDEWHDLDVSFSDYAPEPVAVNAAATKAYFLIPYGEKEVETLFELELATGTFTQLFDGLEADLSHWVTDSETLEPVVGVSYFDKGRYYYLDSSDSRMVGIHTMLTKTFAGKDIQITSRTRDGKKILVRADSDVDPGEYFILDTETLKADFLWANRSWVDPKKMRPMQHMSFQADDGVAYYGYLTMPDLADSDAKPPMLVMAHGGPHVRDYWGYDPEVQLLANQGYAVLQVNFRGSGGYGQVFRKMGHRQWGGKMIGDIINATNDVVESGSVDGQRVCIFGGSYGGFAALMSAVRAPKLYRCAIGYVGVYDLTLMFEEGDIPDSWGGLAYLERVLGRDQAQLKEYSPINHVDEIEAAVMLIHGEKDRRVPVIHANEMKAKLEKAGKNVTWQLYDKSGHGVYSLESRREMYQGVLDFLAEHIGSTGL
jgi:dipeptidyl aminopeptidase/acylaminoacyl peptidase